MWQKIKDVLGTIVGVVVTVLAALSYFLLQKNRRLENQLNQSEAEKQLNEVLAKKEVAHEDAKSAYDDYRSKRDEYDGKS